MPRVIDSKGLSEMQHHTENIRNICILAHVDHGKTTYVSFCKYLYFIHKQL